MTIRTTDEIRIELATNGKALAQANADASLYERLRNAASTAATLRKQGDKLTADLAKAEAAEAKAAIVAFEAANRNFHVERETMDQVPSLQRDRFVITWERLAYDCSSHESNWQAQAIDGFATLPDDVMEHILRHKLAIIPADIMALAPNDPFAAMGRYLTGKRRGYF